MYEHPCPSVALTLHQELTGDQLGTFAVAEPGGSPSFAGPGLALLDQNLDGFFDLAIGTETRDTWIFHNDQTGRFEMATGPFEPAMSIAAGDLDGDGMIDLYLGTGEGISDRITWGNLSLPNTRVPDSEGFTTGITLVDLDGDRDLDVAVSRHTNDEAFLSTDPDTLEGGGNHLLENQGGALIRLEGLLPETLETAPSFQVLSLDADEDGDLDLYWVQDVGWLTHPNQLAINDGGLAFSWPDSTGAELATATMGAFGGDINGDGHLDLWLSDAGSPDLLLSDGEGGFFDSTLTLEAVISMDDTHESSWGTAVVDLDLDGRRDLLAAYGPINFTSIDRGDPGIVLPNGVELTDPQMQNSVALLQRTDGTFEDISVEAGFDTPEVDRSILPVDLDHDGVPELITAGWIDEDTPYLRVWKVQGGCARGLTVRMAGQAIDQGAVVRTTIRGEIRRHPLSLGSAFSSGSLEVSLALGDASTADEVTVIWPDGTEQSWTNVGPGLLVARRN